MSSSAIKRSRSTGLAAIPARSSSAVPDRELVRTSPRMPAFRAFLHALASISGDACRHREPFQRVEVARDLFAKGAFPRLTEHLSACGVTSARSCAVFLRRSVLRCRHPCRALGIRPNSNKGHEIGFKGKGHAMKANGRAIAKNTICLWYDKDTEAAARFYARDLSRQHGGRRPPCAQ